jgi:hypothetical protein
MCKSQRDIEVVEQEKRKKDKKMRDTMKALHTHAGIQPPRSPISPSPPEVEIPSVDDRVFLNLDLYYQYGSNFGSVIGASSSSAPPPPPCTSFDLCLTVTRLFLHLGLLLHQMRNGQLVPT